MSLGECNEWPCFWRILENIFGAFEHWLVSNCDLIFSPSFAGLCSSGVCEVRSSARRACFVLQGSSMLLKSRSTSSSLALVLQVFEASCWLMELDLSVLLQLNSWSIGHHAWLLPLRRLMCIQLYKHVAEVVYLWRWHKLYTCSLQVAPYERPALSKAYLFPQGISQEKNRNFPTTCLQCGLGYWLSSS